MSEYRKRDRVFQVMGLTLLIAILVASMWGYPYSLYEIRTPINLIAAILFGFSLVFRIWAHLVLNRNYSYTLEIRDKHRLVKTGPYRHIRHPIYSGTLLAVLSIPIFTSSLPGFLLALLGVPLFIHRIENEEEMLIDEFGDDYRRYRESTWRLLPYVY